MKPEEYKDTTIAWLAGLLEGEGCFVAATDKYPVCLSVNMTDKDIIDTIAQMWNVSVSKPRKQEPHHKQSYRCMIRGGRAITWMKAILPYLGVRRTEQVETAIKSHQPKGRAQKVTREQAGLIHGRLHRGESVHSLAAEFGISKWTVYAIGQGRRSMSV